MAYIKEPKKMPVLLKLGVNIAEKKTGKRMEPARMLSWYPKAAISSGLLESLVTHHDAGISERLLKLIRLQVSIQVNCRFCIDMNGNELEKDAISVEEVEALQGKWQLSQVETLTEQERTAIQLAIELTNTPVVVAEDTVLSMSRLFNERQYVIIATTIAQVNYWARLIKGFGIPPAGFSTTCEIVDQKIEK